MCKHSAGLANQELKRNHDEFFTDIIAIVTVLWKIRL
jgi:hypothetical protein